MTRRALALLLCLAGCGGAAPAGVTTMDAALRARDLARVRERAPELVAYADDAARRAHAALARGERDAADDDATEARLWLSAARAETRRADAEAEATTLREETRVARAEAHDLETQRAALDAQASRLASARAATDELARALERARAEEPRRPRLPSHDDEGTREAARAIATRARLLSSAATALGATPAETAPVDTALASATAQLQSAPHAALDAADRARRLAENALGAARARSAGAADTTAVAELGEAARTAGLEPALTDRGVEVRAALFRGAAAVPDARLVTELAALVTAHPHGPVLVELEALADAASRRTAAQRVARIVDALGRAGVDRARLQAAAQPASPRDTNPPVAVLVFLGYAPAAVGPAPLVEDATPAAPATPANGADAD